MDTIVLITGATGGIGSALIRRCLREPCVAEVLGVYRTREKWEALFAKELSDDAGRLRGIPSEPAAFAESLRAVLQAGRPGRSQALVLVMAAFAIQPLEAVSKIGSEALRNNLCANLETPILQLQSALCLSREWKLEPRVVYLNSGAAKRPIRGWGLYGAGKSYMNLLLRTLALEEDIPVVSMDPGVVDTAMQEQIRNTPEEIFDQVQLFRDYKVQNRLNSPQDVANYITEQYVIAWKARAFEEKLPKQEAQ